MRGKNYLVREKERIKKLTYLMTYRGFNTFFEDRFYEYCRNN